MLFARCCVRGARLVREATLVLILALASASVAAAQTPLDGILFKFGGDIVTQSDVRQARLLRLLDVDGNDQAYVDAIVNRRLLLLDVKRNPPPEPSSDAIDAKRRQWEARLGPGANVPDLLSRAGMGDAALRGWLRDDLRIEAYLSERFAASTDRTGDLAKWIAVLRQRAGLSRN
jgi:hypothetical protein